MLELKKEPKKEAYRKLIEYACQNNNIISLKKENHTYDIEEKQEYENIFYDELRLSKEEIIHKKDNKKFIQEIYNKLKYMKNNPVEKRIKNFYEGMNKNAFKKEEQEKLEKFLIKDTIDYMIYIIIEIDIYNKKIEKFMKELEKNFLKVEYKADYRKEDVYHYKIDDYIKDRLLEAQRLYEWEFPNRLADLSFYKEEKIWMETITHEEICRIYTNQLGEIQKLKEMGLKFKEVEDYNEPIDE